VTGVPVRPIRPGVVHFVGAGPGAPDLLTVRAARLLEAADLVVFAGSLVPEEAMRGLSPGGRWIDSAGLTREEIVESLARAAEEGKVVVRLASGDPSLFGAMAEMTTALDARGIPWEVVPGVSSVFAAAAALGMELTLPEVSQTVILTRTAGRTPMPPGEDLPSLAAHGSTLVVFLSIDRIGELVSELKRVRPASTPVAVVARASWENERICRGTLETIEEAVEPIIFAEALDLIERHHDEGRLVVIVSASPAEIVVPLGRYLGADATIASKTHVDETGRYTGTMEFYAYGEFKAEAMRALAQLEGIDLSESYAYSDSYTDLPMLEAVGHPVAVNPDRVLARYAREHGYEITRFVQPVRLRDRVRDVRQRISSVPPRPALTASAVVASVGASAFGIGWWLGRKR